MRKIGFAFLMVLTAVAQGSAYAKGCNSSLDCGFAQFCEKGVCTPECRSSLDCGFGQFCEDGFCTGGQPECRSSLDCGFAQHCSDEGKCVGDSGRQ